MPVVQNCTRCVQALRWHGLSYHAPWLQLPSDSFYPPRVCMCVMVVAGTQACGQKRTRGGSCGNTRTRSLPPVQTKARHILSGNGAYVLYIFFIFSLWFRLLTGNLASLRRWRFCLGANRGFYCALGQRLHPPVDILTVPSMLPNPHGCVSVYLCCVCMCVCVCVCVCVPVPVPVPVPMATLTVPSSVCSNHVVVLTRECGVSVHLRACVSVAMW